MDSLLTPGWLGELGAVPLAAGEAATASIHARSVGVLDEAGTGRLCAATTTLLRAIGNEEPDGGLAIRATTAGDVPGLEVVVASAAWRWLDAPEDVEALRAGVDALDLDRRHGEGACARIRVYAEPPGSQAEVGVAGRPHPAETVSGDEAFVVERDGWLIVAVIDGLGHGPGAHAESVFAVEQLQRSAAIDPTELLADCQGAFRDVAAW